MRCNAQYAHCTIMRQGIHCIHDSKMSDIFCDPVLCNAAHRHGQEACPEHFVMAIAIREPMARISSHAHYTEGHSAARIKHWLDGPETQGPLHAAGAEAAARGECEAGIGRHGVPRSFNSYGMAWGGAYYDNFLIR